MKSAEERLAALETRLQKLEDQAAIYQLLACYGIAADSGSAERASRIWTEDGVYDLHSQIMDGRADIVAELEGAWHQGLIQRGSAHVMGMPHVSIDGDEAVATSQSRLYRREDDGTYRVLSCSANRWEFWRTPDGWRCSRRISRKLDGSAESHAVLAQGLREDGE
ncbi:MAG: nuclear transport factor 2 family protein [Beijerinckiaceae bacterium]